MLSYGTIFILPCIPSSAYATGHVDVTPVLVGGILDALLTFQNSIHSMSSKFPVTPRGLAGILIHIPVVSLWSVVDARK